MFALKMFALVCLFVSASAAILLIAGLFNSVAASGYGFILAALYFFGIVMVLPLLMDDYYSAKRRI